MFNYVCTGTMVTLPTRDSTLCRRKVEDVLLGEDSFPVDSPHSAQTLVRIWTGCVHRRSIGLELDPADTPPPFIMAPRFECHFPRIDGIAVAGRGVGLLIDYSVYWIGREIWLSIECLLLLVDGERALSC